MSEESNELVPSPTQLANVDVDSLLTTNSLSSLTLQEKARHDQFTQALNILGQAASGALVCPGNQEGVADTSLCPYAAKCELLKAHKAPQGELCPIERDYILSRYKGQCESINRMPGMLREDERSYVSEMVWIDVEELRCTSIVSRGSEASRLSQINVKDTNPETGEMLSWERVVHANITRLDQLSVRRRMLLRDWMKTPEQKAKLARWMGKLGDDGDISRRQSARADRLKNIQIIEAEFQDIEPKS